MRKNRELVNMVLTSTFIAMGIILPFINFGSQELGRMLLPMHIPILLCGFICGYKYGLIAGFITPILRSVLVSVPPMFPTAVTMAFELATYGFVAGLAFTLFFKYRDRIKPIILIYIALISSLVAGRLVWALVASSTYVTAGWNFNFDVILNSTLIGAWPGLLIQLFLIPLIIYGLLRNPNIEDHILNSN